MGYYSHAQTNFGKHWVFGMGNHWMFENDSLIILPLIDSINNFENVSTISDSNGMLQFYTNYDYPTFTDFDSMYFNGSKINNDSSISSNFTVTNGIQFVPIYDGYIVLYIKKYDQQIGYFYGDYDLRMSRLKRMGNKQYEMLSKEIVINNNNVTEKLKIVKHANGKDWWAITQKRSDVPLPCTNTIYTHLIKYTGEVLGPFSQDIGFSKCNGIDVIGEIAISSDGTKVAFAYFQYVDESLPTGGKSRVELFDFDRCNGTFSNDRNFQFYNSFNEFIYGIEFSSNSSFLYVATVADSRHAANFPADNAWVYQINTITNNALEVHNSQYGSGVNSLQMELGLDKKIYFNNRNSCFDENGVLYMGDPIRIMDVIESPDLEGLNCNIVPCKMITDTIWPIGLPNMPNYDLGALSIYEADAGNDTCVAFLSQVQLGKPAIAGVQYYWKNVQPDNIAQPTVTIKRDTFFVLTITDSSIKGACPSREDTIRIRMGNCETGITEKSIIENSIAIQPNPATKTTNISVNKNNLQIATIELIDINGKSVLTEKFKNLKKTHGLNLNTISKGIYVVAVTLSNGVKISKKLVKE